MACTATATISDKAEVLHSLEMKVCVEVGASPDRPNIYYQVKHHTTFETDLGDVLDDLKANTIAAQRVLIYCQSLDMCAHLYAHFHFELGDASYYPPCSPHLSEYRLFGMFHSNTPQDNKDVIIQSLLHLEGVICVVFATVALGMGVDMKNISRVIHYGAPRSVEDYFQESGRGGRSGGEALSTIYWKPADCRVNKNPVTLRDREIILVRRYLENTKHCRRVWLLDHFDARVKRPVEQCCDVCSNTVAQSPSSIETCDSMESVSCESENEF